MRGKSGNCSDEIRSIAKTPHPPGASEADIVRRCLNRNAARIASLAAWLGG